MATKTLSVHDLKAGDIVQYEGARLIVVDNKDLVNFAGVTKTVTTWVELVSPGEEPIHYEGAEWAIGTHKDAAPEFQVETPDTLGLR